VKRCSSRNAATPACASSPTTEWPGLLKERRIRIGLTVLSMSLCLHSLLGATVRLSPGAPAPTTVVAITTDWATGGLTAISTESPEQPELDLTPICPDAVARAFADRIYVVNRQGCGSIQIVDPGQGFETTREFSTGGGSNPQDIALISERRAYVSRYDSNLLLEFDPEVGAVTDTVDLSSFADSDGLCEMYTMEFVPPYLYVTLQRLNHFQVANESMIAVVDTETNELVDTIPDSPEVDAILLQGRNPFGRLEVQLANGDSRLLVATAGSFADKTDGGLETIDLTTWKTEGILVDGKQLGGDLLDFATYSETRTFGIVADAQGVTSVIAFDPNSDSPPEVIVRAGGYEFNDCLVTATGQLWVADQNPIAPGIRIFDSETGVEQTATPISTGLPPFALLELPGESGPIIPNPPQVAVYPNPTRGGVELVLRSNPTGPATVFDAHGRVVRRLGRSGANPMSWDGKNELGRNIPSGRYWVAVPLDGGIVETGPVQVLR